MSPGLTVRSRPASTVRPPSDFERPVDLQDDVAHLARRLEADVGEAPARGHEVVDLELFQDLLPRRGLPALGDVRREALDELLQVLHLLLPPLPLVLLLLREDAVDAVPEVVVARVHAHLAEVDVAGVRADRVQEVPVVGDHDDDVGELDEELLQPGDGGEVEAVGRLVEEQDVGVAEEGLREEDADLHPLVDLPHELLVQGLRRAQAGEERRRLGVGLPPAQLGELRFQLARAHAVGLGEVAPWRRGPRAPSRPRAGAASP